MEWRRLSQLSGHIAGGSTVAAATVSPIISQDDSGIFDMSAPCVRAFDRTKFERDGFWMWDNVMRPACRQQLTAALQNVQRIQDELVMDNRWANPAAFTELGLSPPRELFTRAERQQMVGGCQISGALTDGVEPLDEAERQLTLTPHPLTGARDPSLTPEPKYRQRLPMGKWGACSLSTFRQGTMTVCWR